MEAAEAAAAKLADAGIRVSVDRSNEKVGAKIRNARLDRVPRMIVLGQKEVDEGTVSVRHRDHEQLSTQTMDEFISAITTENAERSL